jgi:hypothetical protein
MRARCKSNRGDDFELPYFDPKHGRPDGHVFDLTPGRLYTVYAVGFKGSGTWLYVAEDHFIDGPRKFPVILFELEDPSVSKYWVLTVGRLDSEQPDMLAPVEWGREPWFFNRIVDGEPEAVAIFAEMKTRLDLEAGAIDDDG